MVILLSVSPSKEMGNRTRQRKKMISAGITPTTSGFDCPLLDRVSYENRREQIVGDYGNKMIAAMEM